MSHWLLILIFLFTFSCKSQTQNEPQTKQGNITFISSFASEYVDPRPVVFWKSPQFKASKEHIVIVMHDGQMLFDQQITWNHEEWHVDEHLSEIEKKYPTYDFIVVGIYNNGIKRHSEYFPQRPFLNLDKALQDSIYKNTKRNQQPLFATPIYSDSYLSFITKEIIPYTHEHFGISKVANTWIGGASMGGLISWYALNEYPQVFGKALCFSTHWPGVWPQDDPYKKVFNSFEQYQIEHPLSSEKVCYFDHGDETLDQHYAPYQERIDKALEHMPLTIHSLVYPKTDHSERSWSTHFPHAVELLLK